MPDHTTITVTCRCGARLEIETEFQSDARIAAEEFYAAHHVCLTATAVLREVRDA